jgi:hypothetical protein
MASSMASTSTETAPTVPPLGLRVAESPNISTEAKRVTLLLVLVVAVELVLVVEVAVVWSFRCAEWAWGGVEGGAIGRPTTRRRRPALP